MKTKTQITLVKELLDSGRAITPSHLSDHERRLDGRLMTADSIRRHCSTLYNNPEGGYGKTYKKGQVTYRLKDVPDTTCEEKTIIPEFPIMDGAWISHLNQLGKQHTAPKKEEQRNLFNFDLP